MYLENGRTVRDEWRYTYRGVDLLPNASALLAEYIEEEERVRTELTAAMEDRSVDLTGEVINNLKTKAEKVGKLCEQLKVWVHEFTASPDKDFSLTAGDVVFFRFPVRI